MDITIKQMNLLFKSFQPFPSFLLPAKMQHQAVSPAEEKCKGRWL
jgi:hypothetical protein